MATTKQIDANRENAKKSTGPKTIAGKARSRMNAVKHGFTAENALSPEEAAEMQGRLLRWTPSLAPDDDPVKVDLLKLAVRSYHKIERIHNNDDAEAQRRVRNSDALWKREQAAGLVETVALFDENPLVAAFEIESTVAGCEWAVDVLNGMIAAMAATHWLPENHKLLRKLLKFDCRDPKGAIRVPDIWYEKIHRYNHLARHCNTPIAQLPWEIRTITCEKLTLAAKHDVDLLDKLQAEALPLAQKVEDMIFGEIARFKAVRDALLPLEEIDREQAKVRALVDDSPASKQRARYLKDAERALHSYFKEIADVWKLQTQMGVTIESADSDETDDTQVDATPEQPPETTPSRNEPNPEPSTALEPPTHEQASTPVVTNAPVARADGRPTRTS